MKRLALVVWISGCTCRTDDVAVPPPPPVEVRFEANPEAPGLAVTLSDAHPRDATPARPPLTPSEPLSDDAVQALLSRVPDVVTGSDDRQAFALRPGSAPPPLSGSDVHDVFPPAPDIPAPTVGSGPLHVVRFMPSGEVPMAPHVSLTFDQPMVAVTSESEAAKTVPATLSPTPPGRWRWLGTKTLLFDADPRLPMATEFTVEVPAGTTSLTGGILAEPQRFTFGTPPVQLVGSWPSSGPQGLDPLIVLSFDQAVDGAKVLPTVTLRGSGVPALRLATAEEIAADAVLGPMTARLEPKRWVAMKAVSPLPKDTQVEIRVAAGLPSAEGPRTNPSEQHGAFFTYAPLRIVGHDCNWGAPCPPTSPWAVRFDNPLDPDAIAREGWSIAPEVPGFSVQPSGNAVALAGAFVGRTTYTVTVPAGVTDAFGQTLGTAHQLELRIGPADKTLSAPGETMVVLDPAGPSLPVWSTNHEQLQVTVNRVGPEDWDAWRQWLMASRYPMAHPRPPPGTPVYRGTLRPTGTGDALVESAIDFSPWTTDGSGQFVVRVEPTVQPKERWNRQFVYRWVQVTGIGLTVFADPDRLVGWATDLQTGNARPGTQLELWHGKTTAETGPDGLASLELPVAADAGALLVARSGTDLAILPENEQPFGAIRWVKHDQLDQLRWWVADDRGLYRPGEQARVKGWLRRFEHGPNGDIAPVQAQAASIDWVLVSSRNNEIAQGSTPLSGLGGFEIALALPRDVNLGAASLHLTAVGVPDATNLVAVHPIQIQEFRRPEFEVTASIDDGPHLLGEDAIVDVAATYYAGGGLAAADAHWIVYATPTHYVPPGWASHSFGTWTAWWRDDGDAYRSGGSQIAAMTGKTDGAGKHQLGIHFDALKPARPMSVRAEAAIQDVNRQTWTASATTVVHPSRLYVGLKTDKAFVEKGEPIDVDVVVVDLDGKVAPGVAADLRIARLAWGRKDGRWGEIEEDPQTCQATASADGTAHCSFPTVTGGSYRIAATVTDEHARPNESELRVWVSGAEVTPARDVQLEALTLVPEKRELRPGEVARILVQSPFWPAEGILTVRRDGLERTERFRMEGPTRTIEVPVTEDHVPNLTVQVNLVGEAPRTTDDGKPDDSLAKRIAHAVGTVTFDVPPLSRTLTVKATPAVAAAAPGAQTAIVLQVTGADGKPVADAEVVVVVADESVLGLTGYRLPDPIALFYAARGPNVFDYHLRSFVALTDPSRLTAEPPDGQHEENRLGALGYEIPATGISGGDAGGLAFTEDLTRDAFAVETKSTRHAEARITTKPVDPQRPGPAHRARGADAADPGPAIDVRTDFSALALLAPDVRTDAAGLATVPLALPDSLTRYRIMVVAVDAGNRFGSTDAAITARKPLMVRPSAPRFLNFGDQTELPVVVQNQTDKPLVVDLAIRATNVQFVDAIGPSLPDLPDTAVSTAGRRVQVPPNDRVEVRFPTATSMAGTARFQVVAGAGPLSDAADFTLPVWTPATTEAFATYGEVDDGGIVQPIQAPPGVWPQFGGLDVTTSSTQLQALTDAVLYLQSYPFDSSEQLASRVMAIASLKDVLSAFASEALPSARVLEAQVDADLERLASRQDWNGGWSFWRKGDETWPYLSIHVANALARARGEGYTVPPEVWSRAADHLRNIEQWIPSWYGEPSRVFLQAYALDVRRRMGEPDVAKARSLYRDHRAVLGIDGLAFLLPTLHDGGAKAEEAAILRELGNRVTESAGTAHFVTSYSDGAQVLLHSDRRADGIVLEALIETAPDDELIAKVVRGLLAHQTKGRWENTQENAFVLLALDRYFETCETETPDFVARIWLGAGYAGDHAFRGRTTERSHVEVPMGTLTEQAGPQPLTLVKDGDAGRLYYRIGLRYAPKDLRLAPADNGFAVERSYVAIDDPADVRRDPDGSWHIRAGSRIRVELKMANAMRRYHVALVDPLPAGLEAQNPVLATTGTLPSSPPDQQPGWWWWSRPWQEHENLRDERVEAFTSLLWDGVHDYDYVARATTPGRYVVPPARAEEMYMPETFGRTGTDIVVVE